MISWYRHFLCWALLPCTFSAAEAQWIEGLPVGLRRQILWSADHEEGTFGDWSFPGSLYPGGGEFHTGGKDAIAVARSGLSHSGIYSAEATIRNAIRGQNGARAVRLMRWTDRPFDNGGKQFPRLAYYSTWMYFPATYNPNKYPPWDPGDGGWWNVFQFKADDAAGNSQPMWSLNVRHDDATQQMFFYLYSPVNQPKKYRSNPRPIPVGRWFHVEALYLASANKTGRIAVWQNGQLLFNVPGVVTALMRGAQGERAVWGIGNYTDHVNGPLGEGTAILYFDDAIVSRVRISANPQAGIRP